MWFGDENFTPEIVAQRLRDDFDERKRANPRYSLRAYARHLEVDHSALSKILRGERQIAWETAKRIRKKIEL